MDSSISRVLAAASLIALTPGALAAAECEHEASRSLRAEVSAAELAAITSGSGPLTVQGVAGLGEVRVQARLCASREGYLEDMDVTLTRRGARLDVDSHYPRRVSSLFGRAYASISLVVQVPEGLSVEIDDGSGPIRVSSVGALRIGDGSGEIVVEDTRGPVRIDDGSGSMRLGHVRGPVSVVDGSGEIQISEVEGDVQLSDGSGSITISGVRGGVTLFDGSGSITVRGVRGNLLVREDGSGSIDVREIAGNLTVRSDGSGGIRFRDVAGTVELP